MATHELTRCTCGAEIAMADRGAVVIHKRTQKHKVNTFVREQRAKGLTDLTVKKLPKWMKAPTGPRHEISKNKDDVGNSFWVPTWFDWLAGKVGIDALLKYEDRTDTREIALYQEMHQVLGRLDNENKSYEVSESIRLMTNTIATIGLKDPEKIPPMLARAPDMFKVFAGCKNEALIRILVHKFNSAPEDLNQALVLKSLKDDCKVEDVIAQMLGITAEVTE